MSTEATRELFSPLVKAIGSNSAVKKSRAGTDIVVYTLDELTLQLERLDGKVVPIALGFDLFGETYTLLPGGSIYISEDPSTVSGLTHDVETEEDLRYFLMDDNSRFMAMVASFLKWRLTVAKVEHF